MPSDNPQIAQALEAAKTLREAVKWLTAGCAAVATSLVAGTSFSRIGALSGARLVAAVLGFGVSLCSVMIALKKTSDLLAPLETSREDSSVKFRAELNGMVKDAFGEQIQTVEQLEGAFDRNADARAQVSQKLGIAKTELELHTLQAQDQVLADIEAAYRDVLDAVTVTGGFWRLRDEFLGLRRRLLFLTILTTIGVMVFTLALGAKKDEVSKIILNLDGGHAPNSGLHVSSIGGPVEPFESGVANRLEAERTDICQSNLIGHIYSAAPHGRASLLLAIGSADKFELGSRLKGFYGSNDGLAQARARAVLDCLAGAIPADVTIALTRGPSAYGQEKSRQEVSSDRSVSVYAVFSADH